MKIETSNSAAPWELEITTNTAGTTNGHPNIITVVTPFGGTATTIQTPTGNPTPRFPLVVFDAGNPSSTDTNIVGTH